MTSTQTDSNNVGRAVDGYRQLVQLLSGAHQPELPDSSVTMAQMRVLMLLNAIGEQRMSELATALRISLSTLSGLVERLVESQLVVRRTDEHDRRQVNVSLSELGVAFLDHFQELGLSHLRQLLALLTPAEVDAVTEALRVLIQAARSLPKEENK
jgi:DNA-binding MarR family transcriptional regulator